MKRQSIMNHKKVTSLFLLAILSVGGVFAQSKEDLKSEIEQLKQQNQMLMQMMQMMQNNQQMYQQQGMYLEEMQYPQQGYAQQMPQGQMLPSQFGQAIQRTRVEDAAMTSTGKDIRAYGRDQSAKSNFARNKAENQARMELARQIEAYARYAMNQYNDETTARGNTGLDANDQESSITAAKNVIEGAKIIDSQEYYDNNSKMYTWEVCVAYDRADLYSVMEEQSKRIKENKAGFEKGMQKSFDEMDHMQGRLTEAEKAQAVKNQFQQDQLNAQHQRDMQMQQQRFDNNQQSVQQQQQYNLQYQQQQNQYNLQQNQQNQQYNQQRQYNGQNYQYQQGYQNGTHRR